MVFTCVSAYLLCNIDICNSWHFDMRSRHFISPTARRWRFILGRIIHARVLIHHTRQMKVIPVFHLCEIKIWYIYINAFTDIISILYNCQPIKASFDNTECRLLTTRPCDACTSAASCATTGWTTPPRACVACPRVTTPSSCLLALPEGPLPPAWATKPAAESRSWPWTLLEAPSRFPWATTRPTSGSSISGSTIIYSTSY